MGDNPHNTHTSYHMLLEDMGGTTILTNKNQNNREILDHSKSFKRKSSITSPPGNSKNSFFIDLDLSIYHDGMGFKKPFRWISPHHLLYFFSIPHHHLLLLRITKKTQNRVCHCFAVLTKMLHVTPKKGVHECNTFLLILFKGYYSVT